MSAWQPIETAPKDGTAVWVLLDGWPFIGYCEPHNALYTRLETWIVQASFRRRDRSENLPDKIYGTSSYDVSPTHWMPLPEPPVQP